MGVIGRRVSVYIPQTPRRSPEEHNSARGKMPRRGLVSYEQFEGGVQYTNTEELFGLLCILA